LLAVAAFAAAFAIASNAGDSRPAQPVPAQLVLPTATPVVHNLERVEGIRPLSDTP
jgi:hypothetical protein